MDKYDEIIKAYDFPINGNVDTASSSAQNRASRWGNQTSITSNVKIDNANQSIGDIGLNKNNIAENIGNFTGGTKIGQGLGQALASGINSRNIEKAQTDATEIQNNLIQQIKSAKSEGRDTKKLEKALKDIGENISDIGTNTENILNPNQLTTKQVLGDALQLGTTVLGVGTLPGSAKKVVASQTIGQGLAKGALQGAKAGAAGGTLSGIAEGLKKDGNLGEVATDAAIGLGVGTLGGTLIGGLTGGISGGINARKLTPQKQVQTAVDAVSPELTGKKLSKAYQEVISGKRNLQPSTLFTEQKLSPGEQTEALGYRLRDVVKSTDPRKNLLSLANELTSTESKIDDAFTQGDVIFNADKPGLFEKLSNVKTSVPREFTAIKENKQVFDNAVEFGEELLQNAEDTPRGLREARKLFDKQAQLEYPNAFKEGAVDLKTPAGRAIKMVRDAFNQHLYDTAPNGSQIKSLIAHEADLYRANENVALKALKTEGETKLTEWMKKNPGKVKAISALLGGTVLAGLGGTIYASAKD